MLIMNEEIIKSVESLAKALKEDPRILRLNQLEEELSSNPEVIELSQKKDRLEREYETVLSYAKEDSLEAKAYEKALYEAKLALDSHPLVQEYNSLYVPIRDLYIQMDDILFGPFRSKTLSHEAK